MYKSGPFILTLLCLYALFHPTVYKSDCHIHMSCIMGPYFVQVGAFHPNPIIFICIISSDFVQVVAFILILLEWHIHKLFFHQILFHIHILYMSYTIFLSMACILGPYFVQVGAFILKFNYHIAFHNFLLLTNIFHVHVQCNPLTSTFLYINMFSVPEFFLQYLL